MAQNEKQILCCKVKMLRQQDSWPEYAKDYRTVYEGQFNNLEGVLSFLDSTDLVNYFPVRLCLRQILSIEHNLLSGFVISNDIPDNAEQESEQPDRLKKIPDGQLQGGYRDISFSDEGKSWRYCLGEIDGLRERKFKGK